MTDSRPTIAVGIAGWSYPDWAGIVHDAHERDPLAFLAQYVDMFEVNSTFYRLPTPQQTASWVRRTAAYPSLFFTAKLSREITHEKKRDMTLLNSWREGLSPLNNAKRFQAALAQFRYDFDDQPAHRDLTHWIADSLRDFSPLVLEFRHNSWQTPEALAFLDSIGVSVAHLDYPKGQRSFDLDIVPIGNVGYFRLHGQNTAAWFDSKAGRDEVYNYYYPPEERKQLVARAKRISAKFRSLTIVANNHYQGKEVANALQLKAALADQRVAVPPRLLDHYPELREIADAHSIEVWRAMKNAEPRSLF